MPTGLEEERRAEAACELSQRGGVSANIRLRAAVVGDAEAAAGVEVPKPDPRLGELAPELPGSGSSSEHGPDVEQLRTDVERESHRLERRVGRRPAEGFRRLTALETELARGASGGEVLVPPTGDVGIQPDGDRRNASERPGRGGDLLELLERFDVERTDPGRHGGADLVLALADS